MLKFLRRSLTLALLPAVLPLAAVQAQTYQIEPNHTYPGFEVQHLAISWWRGKFTRTTGTINLDRSNQTGTVQLEIDPSSIEFGHAKMAETALGARFFNTERYPKIVYQGKIVMREGQPAEVDGQLTLLGLTRPLALKIQEFKCREHPMLKREICGADAYGAFNRADFGMDYGVDTHGGQVRVVVQVEAIRSKPEP